MSSQPMFVGAVRNESCIARTGVSADTGPGTLLFQADVATGSRIHAISAQLTATITTATVMRMWLKTASDYKLVAEIALPTYTRASGVAAPVISLLDYENMRYLDPADRYLTLDAGDSLYVAVYDTVESDIHVTAFGGDF